MLDTLKYLCAQQFSTYLQGPHSKLTRSKWCQNSLLASYWKHAIKDNIHWRSRVDGGFVWQVLWTLHCLVLCCLSRKLFFFEGLTRDTRSLFWARGSLLTSASFQRQCFRQTLMVVTVWNAVSLVCPLHNSAWYDMLIFSNGILEKRWLSCRMLCCAVLLTCTQRRDKKFR